MDSGSSLSLGATTPVNTRSTLFAGDDGARAFVWGADTSILHEYLPELAGGEIELSYPTHFQVVEYNEDFSVVSVHKELLSLFQRDARDSSTPEDAVSLPVLP